MSFERQTIEEELGIFASDDTVISIAGKDFVIHEAVPAKRRRKQLECELGEAALVEHQEISLDDDAAQPTHSAYLARLTIEGSGNSEVDSYHHSVRVTEPRDPRQRSSTSIWVFPGLAETTETGVGRVFHDTIARELPDHRVISVATTGVGGYSDRLSFSRASVHARIQAMAKQRADLMDALDKKRRPKVVIATSMGSVITHKMLEQDIEEGNKLNIAGVGLYAPAWVRPHNKFVRSDMHIKFVPRLIAEVGYLLSPFSPLKEEDRKKAMRDLRSTSLHFKDLPAMAWQIRDLTAGIPHEEMDTVLRNYPTVAISGDRDPVGQIWKQYAARTDEFPNFRYVPIKGAGHGMAIIPRPGAEKTVKELRNSNILGRAALRAA